MYYFYINAKFIAFIDSDITASDELSPSFESSGEVNVDFQHDSVADSGIIAHYMSSRMETTLAAPSHGDSLSIGEWISGQRLSSELLAGSDIAVQNSTLNSQQESTAGSTVKVVTDENSPFTNDICTIGEIDGKESRRYLKEQSHGHQSMHSFGAVSRHYTCPPLGHRKKGQQLKKKKCYLFQHKRSTLYNGLCSSKNVCEQKDTAVNNGRTKGSIINSNHAEISGARQTCFNSVIFHNEKVNSEATANNCDNSVVQKKSPGRPKGTHAKQKVINTAFQRTIRNRLHKPKAETLNKVTGIKPIWDPTKTSQGRLKRPRGRPRKNTMLENIFSNSLDIPITVESVPGDVSLRSHSAPSNSLKSHSHSAVRQKYIRAKKMAFTQNNKTNQTVHWTFSGSFKKPVFQDDNLSATLKNVGSSVKSQFMNKDSNIDDHILDSPFRAVHPVSAHKLMKSGPPNLVKPKAKKPKLHVMMRRTKRKRRKMPQNTKIETTNAVITQQKLHVVDVLSPMREVEKFVQYPRGEAEEVSSVPEKASPYFTSLVQPPKILTTSSSLNVFLPGTVLDGPHRSGSSTDIDQSDWPDRRCKKRHHLLYRKSKHKNIIDPVFAADLESLVSGLIGLSICENPADNFIKVRPGEVPLPSIFRVIKIDVNKKLKERTVSSEGYGADRSKHLKNRRSTPPLDLSSTSRPAHRGHKKSSLDQPFEYRDLVSLSDSGDQCLPPKKRHRLVNVEASSPFLSSGDEAGILKKDLKLLTWNRMGRCARRSSGLDERKQGM